MNIKRRRRDLNPRAALATYTLSRGASSATWVLPQTTYMLLYIQDKLGAMGLNGLEPSTSRLSGVRSNQLSYRPIKKAGEENRTPIISLEGWGFTTKLHPHKRSRRESNPRSSAWQADMLTPTPRDLCCYFLLLIEQYIAGTGLEPVTFGLWARRAANCSTPR